MDLRIKSDSEYDANNANSNGVNAKGFLRLNFRGNVSTGLNFTFFDNTTQTPVTLPSFVITIYDFDRGATDNLGEIVRAKSSLEDPAGGFDRYVTTGATSTIDVSTAGDGWTVFSATVDGTGSDNPAGTQGLTED